MGFNRIVIGVGVARVAVVAWGAFAVSQLGYTWPYPRVLPDTDTYGLHRQAFNGYLLVAVGGCYVQYEANASGWVVRWGMGDSLGGGAGEAAPPRQPAFTGLNRLAKPFLTTSSEAPSVLRSHGASGLTEEKP